MNLESSQNLTESGNLYQSPALHNLTVSFKTYILHPKHSLFTRVIGKTQYSKNCFFRLGETQEGFEKQFNDSKTFR